MCNDLPVGAVPERMKEIVMAKQVARPRAWLTDHEVDLIRELFDELVAEGKPVWEVYRLLAEKFEMSFEHARTS